MRAAILSALLLPTPVTPIPTDDQPPPKVKVIGGGEIPKGAKIVGLDQGKVTKPELRTELLTMMEEDQKGRRELMALHARLRQGDDAELRKQATELGEKMQAIDTKNTARMKEILEKHGWPGKDVVGFDGAQAAFVMVQHADLDRDFQKQCLPLVKEAADKGQTLTSNLAMLTDRIQMGEGKKQTYGTQLKMVDGKWQPHPIEDEAKVDERRKKVGLPPLAEYVRMVEQTSKPAEKK